MLLSTRSMLSVPPHDLGERTFRFACDIVRFCRGLSREVGIVRNAAWQLAIVLKELRESLLWLRIIIECQLGALTEAEGLRNEANELVSIFTAGMKRLRPL